MNDAQNLAPAPKLLPLIDAIATEIEERSVALDRIDARIAALGPARGRDARTEAAELVAQGAVHRREIRHAHEELARLGCEVLGTAPVQIRIAPRSGEDHPEIVWTAGDPVAQG